METRITVGCRSLIVALIVLDWPTAERETTSNAHASMSSCRCLIRMFFFIGSIPIADVRAEAPLHCGKALAPFAPSSPAGGATVGAGCGTDPGTADDLRT